MALVGALAIHVLVLMGLALSISFKPVQPEVVEPEIVAVAAPPPPPPDVALLAPTDAPVLVPRFRPRQPQGLTPDRQRRHGDPALAVWKYLCNRDYSLGEVVNRECPEFNLGNVDMTVRDPLNRTGDSGIIVGNDTSTMSLDEVGRKKRWVKPKAGLPAEGARAKANDLGLPGHDPFDFLPKD